MQPLAAAAGVASLLTIMTVALPPPCLAIHYPSPAEYASGVAHPPPFFMGFAVNTAVISSLTMTRAPWGAASAHHSLDMYCITHNHTRLHLLPSTATFTLTRAHSALNYHTIESMKVQ